MRPVAGFTSGTRRIAAGLVVLCCLGLAAVGCTDLEETTTVSEVTTTTTVEAVTTTTEPASTTTVAPASSTTTVHVDASEQLLPSGHITACGIITEVWVDGSTRKLKIDYVDFLTGDEAVSAAIDDGVISPGDYLEYYARNNNTMLRTFTVSDTAAITTYSRVPPIDASDPPCSWADFYDFWNLVGPPLPSDMGLSDGLWWIERDGTAIVAIEQQWVP